MKTKIKNSLFKEARFVFKYNGGAPAAAPSAAPAATAASDAPAAKVEAGKKTGAELLKLATAMDLAKLKEKTPDFDKLVSAIGLNGKTIEARMSSPLDLSKLGDSIKPFMDELLKDKDFSALAGYLRSNADLKDLEDNDVKEILSMVYKNSAAAVAQKAFKDKYPYFDDFVKADGKFESMTYKITVENFSEFKPEFPTTKPGDFEAKYKEFADKQKADGKEPEKAAADVELEQKAAAIEKSWVGRFMVNLGLVKKGEFADVASGSNSIAAFLVGLFGGSHLLSNGVYEGMVADLSPKHAKALASLEKSARSSMVSLAKTKTGETASNVGPEEINVKDFAEVIAGKREVAAKGILLKNDYKIEAGKKLKVDLAAGEIVILKGTSLFVDGVNKSAVDKDESLKGKTVELTGTLTKGLIVKGKPKFELV